MSCPGSWSLTAKDIKYNGNFLECKLRTKKGKWLKNKITFFPEYKYTNVNGRFEWDNCKNGVNMKSLTYEDIKKRYKKISIESCISNLTDKYDEWFEIEDSIIQKVSKKCISICLFKKNPNNTVLNEYPPSDEWDTKYLKNLTKNLENYNQNDKCVDLFLANDLQYLIPSLRKHNFLNIYIMKSSSIGAQPGTLWRFMNITNKNYEEVFIADIDESWNWMKQQKWKNSNNKVTSLYPGDVFIDEYKTSINFATIIGSHIKVIPSKNNFNIVDVMKGFIELCYLRLKSPRPYGFDDDDQITYWNQPVGTEKQKYGWGKIPTVYGFDELFLKHVIYHESYPDFKFL